ncbi:hypothetical protein [Engelhardtia mirabilis]|uniref:Uncharacterized protein n=1 Tax=Engelhardtia mirabilis TaxID=2528011 RepID=A0A518BKI3_9BACT|nr:hypothetical protein Pla133_25710 [Planctomycetes bacterium Pla133]QDV01813.1 hypothetical protein Pla86_25700 [Planctomycetes bacterium Pla86]
MNALRRIDPLLIVVLGVVAIAQAWVLHLPFQVDDFALLGRPWELFSMGFAADGEHVPRFALRWPLWFLWGVLEFALPEPHGAFGYHVVGLTLHLVVTALVASVASKLAPHRARAAGLIAALLFGLAHGAAQAFSWTSAWGDLLMTLFGVAALRALLAGREREGGVAALAVLCWLAMVSKTPGMVIPPVLALWCLLLPARSARRRRELIAIGGAFLAGALGRILYLGSFRPTYDEHTPPTLVDAPQILVRGVAALGQALLPWNRDPLFADVRPALAGLFELATPLQLALGWIGAIALCGLVAAPGAARRWLALAGALVAVTAPVGTLYEGQLTNILGRAAYLPLAVVALWSGLAVAAALARGRASRVVGLALLAVALLVDVILGRHVRQTEGIAAAERGQQLESLLEAGAGLGPNDTLILHWPPFDMGGIAQVGPLLGRALLAPLGPHRSGAGPRIVDVVGEKQLLEALGDPSLLQGRVRLLDVQRDEVGSDAPLEELDRIRASRRLVVRGTDTMAWSEGFDHYRELTWTPVAGALTTRFDPPIPTRGFAGLRLEVEKSGVFQVDWITDDGRRLATSVEVAPTELGAGGRDLASEAPRSIDFRLARGLAAIEIRGPGIVGAGLLETLPPLGLEGPGIGSELQLDPVRPPGPFRVTLPPGWILPRTARLTISFKTRQGSIEVFADAAAVPGPDGVFQLEIGLLHVDPSAAPGAADVPRAPWPAFIQRLGPQDGGPAIALGEVLWTVALLHPSGARAAASVPAPGTFRAPHSGP